MFRIMLLSFAVLASSVLYLWCGAVHAIWWHVRNQGSISFQNHVISAPVLWFEDSSPHFTQGLHLKREPFILSTADTMVIESDPAVKAGTEKSVLIWQDERERRLTRTGLGKVSREKIEATALSFSCVKLEGNLTMVSELSCKAPEVNWYLFYRGDDNGIAEVEQMVRTMR